MLHVRCERLQHPSEAGVSDGPTDTLDGRRSYPGTRPDILRAGGAPPKLRHRTLTAQRPHSYSSAPSKSLGSARRSVLCWPLLAHAEKGPVAESVSAAQWDVTATGPIIERD